MYATGNIYYDDCAKWLASFLRDHIVLRSTINEREGAKQVILLSLSVEGKLLCFSYQTRDYPTPRAFDLIPMLGENLEQQLSNLMKNWERLGLSFWTAETQKVACTLSVSGRTMVNASSLEMVIAYHGLLVCLETHPDLEGVHISDVIQAYKRLSGLLKESLLSIDKAINALADIVTR